MAEKVFFGGRQATVIDLSDKLSNNTSEFEAMPHQISYLNHTDTIAGFEQKYGLGADYWRNGQAWAMEQVALTTHSGTHIDAPYHYAPQSRRKAARTIDQVPFRWCISDGVVLNMVERDRIEGITAQDIQRELHRIGYQLKPFDIVLIRTDISEHFKERGYDLRHPGLRLDATQWLVTQGIRMIGIDAWGIDRAVDVMVDEARAGNKQQLWESHYFGAEQEYCQIEKLCNLAALPRPFGFQVTALPIKLEQASASWARVVAVYEDTIS